MRLEIHIHHHFDGGESLDLLKKIYNGLKQGEFVMALSPEMQAFVDSSNAAFKAASESLTNISADVQRLLNSPSTGLSEEDKAALVSVTDQLNTLSTSLAEAAAVVPEPTEPE